MKKQKSDLTSLKNVRNDVVVSFYFFLLQNTEYLTWKQLRVFNTSFQSLHASTGLHILIAVTLFFPSRI